MNSDDETGPRNADDRSPAETRRWLLRLAVVAIGLWFIVDGLRGIWPTAGVIARVLLVAAIVLGVALLVLSIVHLTRRGRSD